MLVRKYQIENWHCVLPHHAFARTAVRDRYRYLDTFFVVDPDTQGRILPSNSAGLLAPE